MSARATTLWFIDSDDAVDRIRSGLTNDPNTAQALAARIYAESVVLPLGDTDLATAAAADDSRIYVGSYGDLAVVSCSLFTTSRPSSLTRTVNALCTTRAATLLVTEPETTLGVFARWENGELRRSFAASPVDLYEDIGLPFVFEGPFWGGEHPLQYAEGVEPQLLALPFHPQHLAEEANREWVGHRFTRPLSPADVDPSGIPVTAFSIHPAGYEPDPERNLQPSTEEPTAHSSDAPPTSPAPPRRRGRLARYFGF